MIRGLLSNLKDDFHTSHTTNLNYYTSAATLVTALESVLQKRTGSIYGPPGSAKLVYFIDGTYVHSLAFFSSPFSSPLPPPFSWFTSNFLPFFFSYDLLFSRFLFFSPLIFFIFQI